ncbi:MAG: hypothetical protein Q7K55_02260 [Candidatus Levybacteria bacterium]|nr:hypothetical protein [Candidatus Levybacteria bacterium]
MQIKECVPHRKGENCDALIRRGDPSIKAKCQMPEESGPCPIAVSQTGDMSFAQALREYTKLINK